MVAHTYNPSTLETQANSMSTWVISQTLPERKGRRERNREWQEVKFQNRKHKEEMFSWITLLVNF